MEYFFGLGDGAVNTWFTEPSLALGDAGLLDAIPLDFDGDGRAFDAMWDTRGDGVADIAALDLDGDGVPESFFADRGDGTWSVWCPSAEPARCLADELVDGAPARVFLDVDEDGDGVPDRRLVDRDGDGYLDGVEEPPPNAPPPGASPGGAPVTGPVGGTTPVAPAGLRREFTPISRSASP